LSGHAAPRGAVDHLHALRGSRAVNGCRPAQRRQLRAPALAGAAVVPAVLRWVELGRTRLVDQRRMAGVSVVRPVGAGDLPGGPCDEGPWPAVAGVRCVASTDAAPAHDRAVLHTVVFAFAGPHSI